MHQQVNISKHCIVFLITDAETSFGMIFDYECLLILSLFICLYIYWLSIIIIIIIIILFTHFIFTFCQDHPVFHFPAKIEAATRDTPRLTALNQSSPGVVQWECWGLWRFTKHELPGGSSDLAISHGYNCGLSWVGSWLLKQAFSKPVFSQPFSIWRIIPFSKWLITIVIVSPLSGVLSLPNGLNGL